MALSTRLLTLRKSPLLLKLPPYLSALCILIGIGWLLILPLNEYSRQTYISENAILAGQVHTYFGGSEHNVFRAYRQEVYNLADRPEDERLEGLRTALRQNGLKVADQRYRYAVAGEVIEGTNVYGLLKGPRADATEAMVLIAAWRNLDGAINYSGVALALTLARYFSRWSIWSKDILVLIPAESYYGSQAWVEAYHTTNLPVSGSKNLSALPIKAGALQGAVALDYPAGPWGHRFDKLDILYDGLNGALPNLDLLNTAISIASGQHGVGCILHGLSSHRDTYEDRLRTILNGILTQSAGRATGPHSAFMPYHVDAITLKTTGDGWHDEMTFGRVTESLFRSINNLLEHLHQSFFFYILLNANRFVSIGNYLPAAMLVAGSFSISALALWLQSGKRPASAAVATQTEKNPLASTKQPVLANMEKVHEDGATVLIPKSAMQVVERHMALPATILLVVHLLSFIPLYVLNHLPRNVGEIKILNASFYIILVLTFLLPTFLAWLMFSALHASPQQLQILQSFSLLLLGATLSTLATLNFSLAFIIGLLASPLPFLRPFSFSSADTAASSQRAVEWTIAISSTVAVVALCPPVVIRAAAYFLRVELETILVESAKAWHVQGVWTAVAVWGVWWSAWIIGNVVLASGLFIREDGKKTK